MQGAGKRRTRMHEPPVVRTSPPHRGSMILARDLVPLGSEPHLSARAGSCSLCTESCGPSPRQPRARGFLGYGQSPHSRLTSAPNSW
jgi:hypothetical protein